MWWKLTKDKFNENDFAICQVVKTEQKFALVCAVFVR